MERHRTATLLAVALAVTASLPTTGFAADPTTTLRFAVVGGEDHPMARYARIFIDEAAARSGGSLTLEPAWGAGGGAATGYEQAVARALAAGEADVALAASRAWDSVGATSLQALHAPLLIDSIPLAAAVAASTLADELLAGMAEAGLTGLAIWPEDLQHPVAFTNCVEPLVLPEQFHGITVRTVAAVSTDEIVTTLGATPVFVDDYGDEVITCAIDATEMGFRRAAAMLPGTPQITGDVTLAPRFAALAANTTSLDRLSADQRAALLGAAAAARDQALEELVPEAQAAADWCASGGQVALAGPEGVVAFAQALAPITDRLRGDAVAGPAILGIEAMKALTEPGPPVVACGDPAPGSGTAPAPTFNLRPTDDYEGSLPPDGAYRVSITTESLLEGGASERFAMRNSGTFTLTIMGGVTLWDDGGGEPCSGTITSDGVAFTIREDVPDTCVGGSFVWRAEGDDIALLWLPVTDGSWPVQDVNDLGAYFDRTWTRIG